jgi:hypothetical protein
LPDDYEIVKASDLHIGSALHHDHGLRQMIDYVASKKNRFLTLDGDLIEAICVDDKRFQMDTLDEGHSTPIKQCHAVIKVLEPVRDRILCIADGNHEFALQRFGNLVRDLICSALDVPYGTYTYKLTIRDKKGKEQWKMFSTHGARAITSNADDPIREESNMMLAVKRHLKKKAGDCIVMSMGHSHKLIVCPPKNIMYLDDDGVNINEKYRMYRGHGYIDEDFRWYINTGSFYKLFGIGISGYAERKGYDPNQLGYAVIEVNDRAVTNIRKVVL